ncbi:potassium transporter TrkG [Pontivivens insulae]|uniref:Trk system potassium uptake protein TrkG n=1 Tax=Pontivivens insulae TaxID=1639689 RepID=A0A2R8AAW7_9RHOB|nr:potassium transporter TrkG [Pontivivens insulae]RED13279.1 trk system potassium uptake protein TrkH [Pontivivens insulae]SPF29371.1 Trk system potassium uptake protein TrkG [Pontivivens insulae]
MQSGWRRAPLFVYFGAMAAPAMLLPAIVAYFADDHQTARPFLYGAILTGFAVAVLALTLMNRTPKVTARSHLLALIGTYLMLPLWLAVPLILVVPTLTPVVGYLEMVSALTTTGLPLIDPPGSVPQTVHLYRGVVGWLGGFMILLAAAAIMAPLNIGGFEIRSVIHGKQPGAGWAQIGAADASDRLIRTLAGLLPVYTGLTAVLFVLLALSGQDTFHAFMEAMSVMSTSGIRADDLYVGGSWLGEGIVAAFLIIAITSILYDPARWRAADSYSTDPELRLLLALIIIVPGLLFLRHWLATFDVEGGREDGFILGLQALWGAIFTTLSFIATFGQESRYWQTAQDWSGLPTPGIVLMGLMMIGGGVATTAGGMKLLRIYALYKHGSRELRRLTLPHSIGGSGQTARRIRTEGAFIAWIFVMLFLGGLSLLMLGLTFAGLSFEQSLMLGVTTLANTGPGYELLSADPVRVIDFDPTIQLILAAGMILGRVEALAFIALLNPDFWRR